MPNLSQIKRQRMLDFLETLRKEHTDDESIRAFTEIENHLRDKKYGLVWEEHSEHVDEMLEKNIPIFIEDTDKKITTTTGEFYNFILEETICKVYIYFKKRIVEQSTLFILIRPITRGMKISFMMTTLLVQTMDINTQNGCLL